MTTAKPIRHRIVVPGLYACGRKESEGEVGSGVFRLVTCARCREITAARRADARARAAKAGA